MSEATRPMCPNCKSNTQVWFNIGVAEYMCHRLGCHIAVSPTGTDLVTKERHRQVTELGYTAEFDDKFTAGQLLYFARNYLGQNKLVEAGALICAEIDRLNRAELSLKREKENKGE